MDVESCQLTGTYKLFMKAEILTEQLYEKDTVRIETFSDGVFVLRYLLSIEIGVNKDHETNRDLLHALWRNANLPRVCHQFYQCVLAWIGITAFSKSAKHKQFGDDCQRHPFVDCCPVPSYKTLGLFLLSMHCKLRWFYTGYFVL